LNLDSGQIRADLCASRESTMPPKWERDWQNTAHWPVAKKDTYSVQIQMDLQRWRYKDTEIVTETENRVRLRTSHKCRDLFVALVQFVRFGVFPVSNCQNRKRDTRKALRIWCLPKILMTDPLRKAELTHCCDLITDYYIYSIIIYYSNPNL